MTISKDDILNTLRTISDNETESDIVSLGYVSGLLIKDGHVGFSLDLKDDAHAAEKEPLRARAEAAIRALPGVQSVTVVLTAERPAAPSAKSPTTPRSEAKPSSHLTGIENVKAIIAVASGKGGVGKSTTAVNLAIALGKLGLKAGLLDADIYGPSLPRLLGHSEKPQVDGKIIQPISAHGIKAMSIGFLVDAEKAMIWRGPMVGSAITQLLRDVDWGALDVLVVDMPPGTGDAQLTLSQRVPLKGAIIVSTPQDIALIDARKGIVMFNQVNVPILGLIENMSFFLCPSCGERTDIFGHGGAQETAEEMNVPFLGGIPLHMDIRETSDAGTPIVASEPDGVFAKAYLHIAEKLLSPLGSNVAAGPTIRIE